MPEYREAVEAKVMAKEIIAEHHPHLEGAVIAYLMKLCDPPKTKRAMKAVKWASAQKLPDKTLAAVAIVCEGMLGPDFIIEIQSWAWEQLMPEEQRALLDHELVHCKHDEDGFYIADHDLEEFCEIVFRHGAWRPSIRRFLETGQGELFKDDSKKPDENRVTLTTGEGEVLFEGSDAEFKEAARKAGRPGSTLGPRLARAMTGKS